jgi:deoxycytidylate deaminase
VKRLKFSDHGPFHAGPCAKVRVVATLVSRNGDKFESSNFCHKPQATCPRDDAGMKSGEGYHLCREICEQPGHAEPNAIELARVLGQDTEGSTIYVDYTWVCDNCKNDAKMAGVKDIIIGVAP